MTSPVAWNTQWWVDAAGGVTYVIPLLGFPADVCEAVYLKYGDGVEFMTRDVFWYSFRFLKSYPKQGHSGMQVFPKKTSEFILPHFFGRTPAPHPPAPAEK